MCGPLVRINVSVIVEHNGRREQGYSGGGGRFGFDELLRGDEPFEHGREAVRQALGEPRRGGRLRRAP